MTIQIIGQNFDVGESLTEYTKSTIQKKIDKYNQNIISASVAFTSSPHKKVSATIKIALNWSEFYAKEESEDAHSAFNNALTDIETQLSKQLEKIKDKK